MSRTVDPASLRSLDIPIPPPELRYRIVNAQIDDAYFLESGQQCAAEILRKLAEAGIGARGFRDVLDFGCGCSRILRFVIPQMPQAAFSGCDIDEGAIEWSRKNVPDTRFTVVPHLPPTDYRAEQFDLVYALSVFTHLDLPRQLLWLDELRRILRSGGVLLLTIQGAVAYELVERTIGQKQQDEFRETGFLFLENISDRVLPDWYQTAIYKERFARVVFGSGFAIVRYEPRGMTGWQDLLLLRKT
jgi:SAM-dependent methyltransferase